MRIVVRSALLVALMVALPSIAPAQGRDAGDRTGHKAQQDDDASVVSTGSYSGAPVRWPDGWVRESDSDTPFTDTDTAQTVEGEGTGDDRYSDTAQTTEGEGAGDDRYSRTSEGESTGDDRYSDTAQTAEGENGGDYRYGDAAGTVDGGSDYRYGDPVGTVEGDSDYRYGDSARGFQQFGRTPGSGRYGASRSGRYGASAGVSRGRVMNCYIDRRGRTICR